MDFCMIFDLRTKTGGKGEKKSTLFSQLSPPNFFGEAVKFAIKKKQKREGRPIERQTKGKGGGQSTDILQRGSCGRQQEPHPQATLKCWTDQNQKEPWALHVTIHGQSNNHSVKRHEERTSLPRRQQETRFTPSVWCPTIPSTHVSLTFLYLWTKMSEFHSFFFLPVLRITPTDSSVFVLSEGGTDNLGKGRLAHFVKQVPFCQSRGLEWYLPSPSAPQHRGRGLQPIMRHSQPKSCISLVCQSRVISGRYVRVWYKLSRLYTLSATHTNWEK